MGIPLHILSKKTKHEYKKKILRNDFHSPFSFKKTNLLLCKIIKQFLHSAKSVLEFGNERYMIL